LEGAISSQESARLRRELWQQFSDAQVELLRLLRDEVSSRRWKVMLDVDALRGVVTDAASRLSDPLVTQTLAEITKRLEQIHRDLAHIPEDIIPHF